MTIRLIHGEEVHGVDVDHETRCAHWHSPLDIIAIKFRCCGRWYPCFDCHSESADHAASVWPADKFDEEAILCGACGTKLTIEQYSTCRSVCPACEARFNPGCSRHLHLYFET